MHRSAQLSIAATLCALALLSPEVTIAEEGQTFSDEQLDQMLAPIALHPDALLSQVLMASTYPLDVSEAAEWSKSHPDQQGDEAVEAIEDKPWDPSVKSLVAFPPVLAMMSEKPDWVQNLGDAFLAEPERVMDRTQFLRTKAKEAGNLETTEQQKVTVEAAEAPEDSETTTVVVQQAPAQVIVIEPAQPEVVYVPTYNPTVIYGPWWWPLFRPWYWHPVGYGYGAGVATGIAFGIGIGVRYSLWGGFRWGRGSVNINVNRYNNINVNNRIQSRDRNADWKHDSDRRRGTPYRDSASREKFGHQGQAGASRNDYKGRDASRERAQETLAKHGADPAAGREKLRTDPQTRERTQAAASADRGAARSAGHGADRSQARATAQHAERSSARQSAPSRSRDSAFKGAGNASRTQQSISRGSASRSSAGSFGGGRSSGSFGGAGGGMRGGGGRRGR